MMKIIRHSSQAFPTVATGSLVGLDVSGGTLEITNCFPFPIVDASGAAADGAAAAAAASNQQQNQQQNAQELANLAASAPRAKANAGYETEMIKYLREVNVDANNVGWYTSTSMGNFVNSNTIENQFHYQKELNERTVALVHDVSRSSQGAMSLRAFRLSPAFMTAYKEGKFTIESLQKSGLRFQDMLVEIPVHIHNSHLQTTLLNQLPTQPATKELDFPADLAVLNSSTDTTPAPLFPNFDSLDLSVDPFLEKTADLLLESIESHHTELNNHQYYQRSLAREQQKIAAWQAKRKAENATRAATKQPALPEDEWQRIFKLPSEPSRLEILLNSRQVEQYARQVDGFTANITSKMFAVRSNLLPGDG
jgi:translation initiation factor 3 subunit H